MLIVFYARLPGYQTAAEDYYYPTTWCLVENLPAYSRSLGTILQASGGFFMPKEEHLLRFLLQRL